MLRLDRLRVLYAVSTTGSVVGAARSLHVTTSAVSQQIARLERDVGQVLAERRGRGIALTEAGRLLARNAADLLAHAEQVQVELAAHRGTVSGSIMIAAFATAARGLLPGAIRDLRIRHPDLSAFLAEQEPHEAIPALRRGDIDIAIVQDWAEAQLTLPDGFSRQDLCDDTFDVALPIDHPLAGRNILTIAELTDHDWISWRADEICHDWLLRTLHAHGAEAHIRHTASEHSTQVALVAAGLGVAVIPRLGRQSVPTKVRYLPINPPPTRRIYALWRTSTTALPAIRATIDALQRACPISTPRM